MPSSAPHPSDLSARTVAECTSAEVAEALIRSFEGYVVPVRFDARSYERRFRAEDLDPYASRVFRLGGEPAGVLLVARRGWTARIAAMGLAPELRGRGVGRRVMGEAAEEARARGQRALVLEVFERNEPALALYESLGFRRVRRLVGYRRSAAEEGAAPDGPLTEMDPRDVARAVAREGEPDLPWQLAPETLSAAGAPARALTLDGRAFALVADPAADTLVLTALLVRREHRRQGWGVRTLRALCAAFPGRPWAVPQVVPEGLAARTFEAGGWERQPLEQFEMRLPLV